ALVSAKLNVLLVGGRGLLLDLAEVLAERLDARAGDAGVVLEGARQPLRFGAQLPVEIGDLGPELLDAWMGVEQRRGLLGELPAHGRELFAQAADQLGIEKVGGLERLARFERVTDEFGLGLGVRLLRARGGKLGVELAKLLSGQSRVVGADKQIRFAAELFD